jgi:GDPmannose 4,6-dehydratase
MSEKKALIIGISGQDGAYLAELLLAKGYRVIGSSRSADTASFANLVRLGIKDRLTLRTLVPTEPEPVLRLLEELGPDEIYNLSGQSSVGLSFERPLETLASIVTSDLNILEAVRRLQLPVRLFNASSGECFGDTGGLAATELSPFRPRSPYAVAKAAAFWQTSVYREVYGLYACSALLFNHESPLRPDHFVTRKIIKGVVDIAAGRATRLSLGNIAIERDWGWAPEYVEAMWLMLQQEKPDDFIIATGQSFPLGDFVAQAFSLLGLDWQAHTSCDPDLLRPTDAMICRADVYKAKKVLGWQAQSAMPELVRMMLADQLRHESAALRQRLGRE